MENRPRFNLWLALALMLAFGLGIVVVSGVGAQGASLQGTALGTGFTYQGRLTDSTGGEPIAGPCDLRFTLYQSLSGNDPVSGATPQVKSGIQPDDGFFTVDLDFGPTAFSGEGRFLGIEVDCGGGYTALSPRVELTPAPYAFHAVSTGALRGYEVSDSTPAAGQILAWDGSSWTPTTSGVGNTWSLNGNSGTTPGTDFLGTSDNQALELHVNGDRALRLEPDADGPNLVGGYSDNSVAPGVHGATIGGGGTDQYPSQVTANFGTVSGGAGNTASAEIATVGGGAVNTASGDEATVSGGYSNTASSAAATVGGGVINTASGDEATVSGGYSNTASSAAATVGGGMINTASGDDATVGGGYSNTASDTAATVGGGFTNMASGAAATVGGGYSNTVSGDFATIGGGNTNTASGANATVPGGAGAKADLSGQWAYANGSFTGNAGEAQASLYVLYRQTTSSGGTWEDLYLDGVSSRLTVPPTRTLAFDILVVGRSDDGRSGGFNCRGTIENVGWTTSLIGGTCAPQGLEGSWDVQVVADDANDALVVQVAVIPDIVETIRWVATVRTVEVAW